MTSHPAGKPIKLALRGGGAHGAFVWGVLDELLVVRGDQRDQRGRDERRRAHLWHGGRRTKSLDALLQVLYLRGGSTGDFQEALAALLGKDAPNLSPAAIARLTAEWQADYDAWRKRDLSARRYVYVWADGVYP